ncbi:hypothetical protein RJ639_015218 [Escallonia herrerae]|uniref:Uncharacterized protein n=1 Tax=Escallonia herrerae TaxID=1293975 RepID=A0AA88VIN7_9ASTE|nr:hypothetical protein RJ639_015218 [Escallonia herrerae]
MANRRQLRARGGRSAQVPSRDSPHVEINEQHNVDVQTDANVTAITDPPSIEDEALDAEMTSHLEGSQIYPSSTGSNHGLFPGSPFTLLRAFQTTLLHLKPEPKPICRMRSPRLILALASKYANSHQILLLDVFPNRSRVFLEASIHSSISSRFFCISSSTFLLVASIQKCSNASL